MASAPLQFPVREHNDYPVPAESFATLLKGTSDEIWTKHILNSSKGQKKLFAEWRADLASLNAS